MAYEYAHTYTNNDRELNLTIMIIPSEARTAEGRPRSKALTITRMFKENSQIQQRKRNQLYIRSSIFLCPIWKSPFCRYSPFAQWHIPSSNFQIKCPHNTTRMFTL